MIKTDNKCLRALLGDKMSKEAYSILYRALNSKKVAEGCLRI